MHGAAEHQREADAAGMLVRGSTLRCKVRASTVLREKILRETPDAVTDHRRHRQRRQGNF